jgi:hypothetical protein
MKIIYLLIGMLFIGGASATIIDIVYINNSTTAQVYFNNGSTQYHYDETNTLTDDYNTVMITGTIDNSDDLIDNPTIIYDKVLYILAVIFFAFMFLLAVWIIKKVLSEKRYLRIYRIGITIGIIIALMDTIGVW